MSSGAAGQESAKRRALWKRPVSWLLIACVAAAVGAGAFAWRRARIPPAPAVPAFDLPGLDPQIAAVIERARAAVAQSPRSGAAWGTLGAALMANKLHREAMRCLATAEELQPQEPRWPYLQGFILLTWDAGAAIPKLERGIELAGEKSLYPRLRLANLLLERGRIDEAETWLKPLAAIQPNEPHLTLALGRIDFARGRLEDAVRRLEAAGRHADTARASHVVLAQVHQRLGNLDAAEKSSQAAGNLPRDAPLPDPFVQETTVFVAGLEPWLMHADRLLKSGRLQEAVALNEKTVAAYPDSATAWQRLGLARIAEKKPQEAIAAFQRALALAPRSSETHFQMGAVHFEEREFVAAEESFRRTLEIRPGYAAAHYNLGLCLLKRENRPAAIDAFRTAIRHEATLAGAHKQLGAALALEQRFQEAVESLRRAVELSPKDEAAAEMLRRAMMRAEEQGDAPDA